MPRADKLLYGGALDRDRMNRLVVLCVDDTDDVTRATSTGAVAEAIADAVGDLGGCMLLGITRHQLLLAEGVPYTSHNSSMCFAVRMPEGASERMREHAVRQIAELSAASADPGLCVADMPAEWISTGVGGSATWEHAPADERVRLESLAAFGRRAQREICSKDQAYKLAESIPWLQLSEHGGTGQGVIGALAGAGLRLAGNDGRFRGKWDLAAMLGMEDTCASVGAVRAGLSTLACGPVAVCDAVWRPIADDARLVLNAEAKPVLHGGAITLVCNMRNGAAVPCCKLDLDGMESAGWGTGASACWQSADAAASGYGCGRFQPDNDAEESLLAQGRICENCLFRRKVAGGLSCMLDDSSSSKLGIADFSARPFDSISENIAAGTAASIHA